MDALISFEIRIIGWVQGLGQWLSPLMQFFSFMGTEQFYFMIIPAVYWCTDSGLGLRMGLFLTLSNNLNLYLKLILHTPRPFWISNEVKSYAYETSFSMPSGHSQNAAVFWLLPVITLQKQQAGRGVAWAIAILIVILIGVSRAYLGVHFPHDILSGWLLGLLFLVLFLKLTGPAGKRILKQHIALRIVILFAVSLILIIFGILSMMPLIISGFQVPSAWIAKAIIAFPGRPFIQPIELSNIISNSAGFFGLAAGALLTQARGGFSTTGPPFKLLARYLTGIIGVFILWFGLGILFPRGESLISYILRYLRYSLTGLWITGIAPLLFIKFCLAGKLPQSD
jgi:membrane-associated phospholipid phosphatase